MTKTEKLIIRTANETFFASLRIYARPQNKKLWPIAKNLRQISDDLFASLD